MPNTGGVQTLIALADTAQNSMVLMIGINVVTNYFASQSLMLMWAMINCL